MNERLKSAREILHLSQQYVAKCLNITEKEVDDIEAGTRPVNGLELAVLSQLYGIPMNILMNGRTYTERDLQLVAGLSAHDRDEVLNLIGFKKRLAAAM